MDEPLNTLIRDQLATRASMRVAAKIRRRRVILDRKQAVLTEARDALQAECQHPAATKVHKGSTGNYDPSADGYWTEHACPDCGKHWTKDHSL